MASLGRKEHCRTLLLAGTAASTEEENSEREGESKNDGGESNNGGDKSKGRKGIYSVSKNAKINIIQEATGDENE